MNTRIIVELVNGTIVLKFISQSCKTQLRSDAEKFLGLTKTEKFTSETNGYSKLCSRE